MSILKRLLPQALLISLGLLTLLGLLFVPELAQLLTGWAGLLGAVALLVGVINLLGVHLRRFSRGNVYSAVLVLAMLTVYVLAITDALEITRGGVDTIFEHVQVPLEAALAASMAVFLLFAAFRMLQRRPGRWSFLFVGTVLLVLVGHSMLPSGVSGLISPTVSFLEDVAASAGMRGILIGIALGVITVGIRLLVGLERPFEK
jgi:hypothetical protein